MSMMFSISFYTSIRCTQTQFYKHEAECFLSSSRRALTALSEQKKNHFLRYKIKFSKSDYTGIKKVSADHNISSVSIS